MLKKWLCAEKLLYKLESGLKDAHVSKDHFNILEHLHDSISQNTFKVYVKLATCHIGIYLTSLSTLINTAWYVFNI